MKIKRFICKIEIYCLKFLFKKQEGGEGGVMESESDIDEFKVVEEIIDMLEEKRVTCGQAIRICKKWS